MGLQAATENWQILCGHDMKQQIIPDRFCIGRVLFAVDPIRLRHCRTGQHEPTFLSTVSGWNEQGRCRCHYIKVIYCLVHILSIILISITCIAGWLLQCVILDMHNWLTSKLWKPSTWSVRDSCCRSAGNSSLETRKPCCRKETARCRKCSFPLKFANNIHYKYKKD